jgi:hypothetical protein
MTRKGGSRVADPGTAGSADLKSWHCWLILALLPLLFFRNILLGSSFFWEDFTLQTYPFTNFAATSLAAGSIPLWNPYTFNGMPFLADIQTTVFYLPMTALALVVKDGLLHFWWLELVVVLHYILAGIGMYAVARSFGLRRFAALFSGAAYMLSGFMIAHAIHQMIVTLVAWYPLIYLLLRRALHERRWLWVFVAAPALALSILAGFPQLSLYLFAFLGITFLFELLTTFRGRALLSRDALGMTLRAASIILLALAIAAIQLLPTMELAPLSQRSSITYAKATEGSLSWGQLLTFFYPKFFGVSQFDDYQYWGPGEYWHYWETCVYLGIATLLLALMSFPLIRRNRHVAYFWGIGLAALLFSLGNNFLLHPAVWHWIPGFSLFRNPARAGILLTFAAALLSGWSLDRISSRERAGPPHSLRAERAILIGAVGTGLLAWVLASAGFLDGLFPFLGRPAIAATVRQGMLPGVLFLLLSGGAIWVLLRRPGHSLYWGLVPTLLLFLDMSFFGGRQMQSPVNPLDYFARARRITEPLKAELKGEFFRVNARHPRGMVMDRNQGMIDRIFMMEGYTPLALQRLYPPLPGTKMFDLLNAKYMTVVEGNRLAFVLNPTYFPRAFFLYGTHRVGSDSEFVAYAASPEYDYRMTAILEEDPGFALSPPDSFPRWSARITSYDNNEIRLVAETEREGILTLSEAYYPGWTATVDGSAAPILRVDYTLRGIRVGPGRHEVDVRFEPASFARGSVITLAALLLCAGGIVLSLRRGRE